MTRWKRTFCVVKFKTLDRIFGNLSRLIIEPVAEDNKVVLTFDGDKAGRSGSQDGLFLFKLGHGLSFF